MTEHHRTSEWARTVRSARPIIAASLPARCIDCGRPVTSGQKWQVGHITAVSVARAAGWTVQQINDLSNLGPSHAKGPGQKPCNQIAGGKLGARISTQRRRAKRTEYPAW